MTATDGDDTLPPGFDPDDFVAQDEDDLGGDADGAWDDDAVDDGTADGTHEPADEADRPADPLAAGPVIAVVGRPNVGKSTLVNRIVGRREAVVEDVPGVTRDRVTYPTEWAGTPFTLVDTGGWDSRAAGISARIAAQAEAAIGLADAVVMVVDGTVGPTAGDEAMVRLLRRSGRPVVVAVNKVDDTRTEPAAADFWSLGLGEPHGISAMHGRGVGDLLDRAIEAAASAPPRPSVGAGLRRVALVGRPNVGKSSLLNQLAGSDRVIVDAVAGTTRDPVDEIVDLGGRQWLFVDTAGIRRKVRQAEGTEFFSALRTQAALERSEVAVVVVDAAEPLAEQDVRVVSNAVDAGRAVVLAVNKWDLVDDERRHYLEREIETDLGHLSWIPRVNVSAMTGWHVNRLTAALDEALASWDTRIPTGRLNALIAEITAAHPHPVRGGRQPRILYATQPATRPPRFVLFATGFVEAGYRRFVERRIRETFGFRGTPVQVSVRVRAKRRG